MERKFKIGDVVILKSGSPKMVIEEYDMVASSKELDPENIDNWRVLCCWFKKDGKPFYGRYHENMLEKVQD